MTNWASETQEAVARAMWEGRSWADEAPAWDDLPRIYESGHASGIDAQEECRKQARAAILATLDAMKTPSQAMLYNGEGYMDMIQPEAIGPNTKESRMAELQVAWEVMLDRARTEISSLEGKELG